MKPAVFHLGLTMAGAVSAGAYTAGVMDCFLEMLENWERAKRERPNDPLVPQHEVKLEVIGGASAGGMTAALTAIGLFTGLQPVNHLNREGRGNLLYDSWIRMSDKPNLSTIQQLLDTSDIEADKTVYSLLNSNPIDSIADNAVAALAQAGELKLPSYISRDLHILMTLSNLRGVSLGIDFTMDRRPGKNPPVHKMSFHKALAHFRMDPEALEDNAYLLFDPANKESLDQFLRCAKATGAFPIGLRDRRFDSLSPEYIRKSTERLVSGRWRKDNGVQLGRSE